MRRRIYGSFEGAFPVKSLFATTGARYYALCVPERDRHQRNQLLLACKSFATIWDVRNIADDLFFVSRPFSSLSVSEEPTLRSSRLVSSVSSSSWAPSSGLSGSWIDLAVEQCCSSEVLVEPSQCSPSALISLSPSPTSLETALTS